jgi:hypothetical protein
MKMTNDTTATSESAKDNTTKIFRLPMVERAAVIRIATRKSVPLSVRVTVVVSPCSVHP